MAPKILMPSIRSSEFDPQQQIYELFGWGLSITHHQTEQHNWSLRSSDTPYGDLNDLLAELGLAGINHQLQIIALPPIVIDATSRIQGERGNFKIRISKRLPTEKASIGVVVRERGIVRLRTRLSGDTLDWQVSPESDGVLIGTADVPVPKASVAH